MIAWCQPRTRHRSQQPLPGRSFLAALLAAVLLTVFSPLNLASRSDTEAAAVQPGNNLRLAHLYNELYYEGQAEDDKALADPGIGKYFDQHYSIGVVQHIWEFYPDRFTCVEGMERTPTREMVYDGGKWLCGTKNILQRKGCVIYSFGSMGDTRFEQVLLERTRCEIHIFDPSLNKEQTDRVQQLQGVQFHAWGLSSVARSPAQLERDRKIGQLYDLPFIMKHLGHSWIDVLKIDIEGYENAVLQEFYPNPPGVTQLLVELHILQGSEDSHQVQVESTPADVKRTMQALRQAEFKVFHREVNYFAPNYTCWEYSFIRTDADGRALVYDAEADAGTSAAALLGSRTRQMKLDSGKRKRLHLKTKKTAGTSDG